MLPLAEQVRSDGVRRNSKAPNKPVGIREQTGHNTATDVPSRYTVAPYGTTMRATPPENIDA
jgi:hypothetical protein